MKKNIFSDQFMTVTSNDDILILSWKSNTSKLTDESFKTEALKFADIVQQVNNKKIIVDMRKFRFNLSPALVEWRNKNIISVYNKIGAEKFAFISEKVTVPQNDL